MEYYHEIDRYTVALYRERFGCPKHLGSGILIEYQRKYLLITAYHVIDMEEEQIKIENDPHEIGIPQDDLDGIYAKGDDSFFILMTELKH